MMAKSIRATDASPELPLFRGLDQVLELLGKLYRRPRLGEHSKSSDHSEASRGLPMLCLVRPGEHETLLPAIAEMLRKAEPYRVPHAFIDSAPPSDEPAPLHSAASSTSRTWPAGHGWPAEPARPDDLGASDDLGENDQTTTPEVDDVPIIGPDVHKVRDLLVTIAGQLNETGNAQAGRLNFPRLSLALWLMRQDLSDIDMPRRAAELRKRIWRREPAQQVSEVIRTNGQSAPGITAWSVLGAVAVIPWLVWRIRLSSPIPGLGRKYRWFRRQRYLAPEIPGTFLGFAERLTSKEWTQEEPEQVTKFLTNAFLEDIRVAYGRWPWRLRGARRMTYAVALLNNVTRANGGYALLKLINDVRNETGFFDPLLVVTASRKVPPHAVEPTVNDIRDEVYDADEAEQGYSAWRQKLARDRRKRNDMTWYLPISTYTEMGDDRERSAIRKRLAAAPPYTVDTPPWWSRRIVPTVLAGCLLVATTGVYVHYDGSHCGAAIAQLSMAGASGFGLKTEDSECVGVTDGSHLDAMVTNPAWQPRMKKLGDKIAAQNRKAEAESREDGRQLVTVAYLGDLSADRPAAQHETLAGIGVAQQDQNKRHQPDSTPRVRVLVANGGKGMEYGHDVAWNQLRKISRTEPRFVGVVGLNHSREETIRTITTLTRVGLPMIASTLSLDGLPDKSPMYYQVSPQNQDQATAALEFANRKNRHGSVWIYRGKGEEEDQPREGNDLYIENLADDVKREFRDRGVKELKNSPEDAGAQTCAAETDELVYYAGRGADFSEFLKGVSNRCGMLPPSEIPMILAGDDVTQHVAAQEQPGDESGIPYHYQSFAAAPPASDRSSELEGVNKSKFYNSLYGFLRDTEKNETTTRKGCPEPPKEARNLSLDGHAALAHDATKVLLLAVEGLVKDGAGEVTVPIPITPGAVWHQLNNLHSDPTNGRTSLVSGVISPGDSGGSNQVLTDRNIWTLKVGECGVETTDRGD